MLSELETALLDQTPPAQQENPNLHELPHLVVDGIPTPVDKMTQVSVEFFYRLSLHTRSRGYKTFFCSTQLSMKFYLFINVEMPAIVGISTFMSKKK